MVYIFEFGKLPCTRLRIGRCYVIYKLFKVTGVVTKSVSTDVAFVTQVLEELLDELLHVEKHFIHRLRRLRRFLLIHAESKSSLQIWVICVVCGKMLHQSASDAGFGA